MDQDQIDKINANKNPDKLWMTGATAITGMKSKSSKFSCKKLTKLEKARKDLLEDFKAGIITQSELRKELAIL